MTGNATRTSSTIRPVSIPPRCDSREALHVGVDVHKATYHVAVLSDRRGVLATCERRAENVARGG
jgi:hypothetical protein